MLEMLRMQFFKLHIFSFFLEMVVKNTPFSCENLKNQVHKALWIGSLWVMFWPWLIVKDNTLVLLPQTLQYAPKNCISGAFLTVPPPFSLHSTRRVKLLMPSSPYLGSLQAPRRRDCTIQWSNQTPSNTRWKSSSTPSPEVTFSREDEEVWGDTPSWGKLQREGRGRQPSHHVYLWWSLRSQFGRETRSHACTGACTNSVPSPWGTRGVRWDMKYQHLQRKAPP